MLTADQLRKLLKYDPGRPAYSGGEWTGTVVSTSGTLPAGHWFQREATALFS